MGGIYPSVGPESAAMPSFSPFNNNYGVTYFKECLKNNVADLLQDLVFRHTMYYTFMGYTTTIMYYSFERVLLGVK